MTFQEIVDSVGNLSKEDRDRLMRSIPIIEHHHPRSRIESKSIFAGGVGRVRSIFLEFIDINVHKPAPTDPITNAIESSILTHIFTCTGS
jgi:hypothetical protein